MRTPLYASTLRESNREFLFASVRREWPSVRMFLPEATYLAWLDWCAHLENPRD